MNELQKFIAALEHGFLTKEQMPELIRLDPEFPVLVRCGMGRFVCPAHKCAERVNRVHWQGDYVRDVSIPVGSDARAASWQPTDDDAAGCDIKPDSEQPETKGQQMAQANAAEAYQILDSQLKRVAKSNPDAQKRVAQHIRAVTGRVMPLPVYHASKDISEADKLGLYRLCFAAVLTNNYSQLKTVDESKRFDPTAIPAKVPEAPKVEAVESKPVEVEVVEPEAQPDRRLHFEPPVTVAPEAEAVGSATDLATVIARAVSPMIKAKSEMDEARIKAMITEALEAHDKGLHDKVKGIVNNGGFPADKVKELLKGMDVGATRIEFVTPEGVTKQLDGLMHPQVPQIAAWLRVGVPVWAWGAAGSGKTHMARQIAAMLDVEAHVMPVDPTLTVSKIMGYRNVANGEFINGFAYQPYKNGGLLAADEKDTGDAGVMAAANAMLSNGHYMFPSGETVTRNDKFHYLALANTKGMGAVAGYVARNRLDAATLDRFAVIEIRYDEGLELALACGEGKPGAPWKPGKPASKATQKAFVEWVQKVRQFVGQSVLISPRASINGCKALRAGIPLAEVTEALVFKLVAEDSRQRIIQSCQLPQEAK